jgi:hypothetical protein
MMGTKPGLVPGTTSVSPDEVQKCRENGITVIPGSCPNQFLNADPGHWVMRVLSASCGSTGSPTEPTRTDGPIDPLTPLRAAAYAAPELSSVAWRP